MAYDVWSGGECKIYLLSSVWCAKSLQPSTIVYPREQTVSEEGSLYSMRSRLSPHSALSASGSAPASNSNSLHSEATLTFYPRSRSHLVMTCGCSRARGVEDGVVLAICAFYRIALRGVRTPAVAVDLGPRSCFSIGG